MKTKTKKKHKINILQTTMKLEQRVHTIADPPISLQPVAKTQYPEQ
jgi:hypothetical protein